MTDHARPGTDSVPMAADPGAATRAVCEVRSALSPSPIERGQISRQRLVSRQRLADALNIYESGIEALQMGKRAAYTAYRAQLQASGMSQSGVRQELSAFKEAMRFLRAGDDKKRESDAVHALARAILEEISNEDGSGDATRASRHARVASEPAESGEATPENGPPGAEFWEFKLARPQTKGAEATPTDATSDRRAGVAVARVNGNASAPDLESSGGTCGIPHDQAVPTDTTPSEARPGARPLSGTSDLAIGAVGNLRSPPEAIEQAPKDIRRWTRRLSTSTSS